MRRFRVGSIDADEAGELRVDADVHRHLQVLRLQPGAVVHLFDGRGGEVEAQITDLGDAGASLRLVRLLERRVESSLDSCLVQAVPARAARMETIVRQVTEVGVRRIVPVIAERSQQKRVTPAALERRAERWRRVADAAAEQSGRTRVPVVDSPAALEKLSWEGLPRPLFIAEVGAAEAATLSGTRAPAVAEIDAEPAADAVTVLIGPEGGWSPGEIETAVEQSARMLSLGPRVLRADTAGTVALSLFQYLWGDLRNG